MSQREAIVRYVAGNPGCTSKQIGEALGGSAAQQCATLAAWGVLHREHPPHDLPVPIFQCWRYYPAADDRGTDG